MTHTLDPDSTAVIAAGPPVVPSRGQEEEVVPTRGGCLADDRDGRLGKRGSASSALGSRGHGRRFEPDGGRY